VLAQARETASPTMISHITRIPLRTVQRILGEARRAAG